MWAAPSAAAGARAIGTSRTRVLRVRQAQRGGGGTALADEQGNVRRDGVKREVARWERPRRQRRHRHHASLAARRERQSGEGAAAVGLTP